MTTTTLTRPTPLTMEEKTAILLTMTIDRPNFGERDVILFTWPDNQTAALTAWETVVF